MVFVAVERRGRRWTVTADALTAAPGHVVDESACDTIRDAVIRLVRDREVRSCSSPGPVHITQYDVADEERARALAAALHTALYGDLEPLARAVPTAPRGAHLAQAVPAVEAAASADGSRREPSPLQDRQRIVVGHVIFVCTPEPLGPASGSGELMDHSSGISQS
ncbi:hypothetical protein OG735_01790 [Streptomyces sp. NBC_01210]|uniref:hypothetical protein n=1 Tax=Streptomyces sp. NBC_01210 TaxID=2903774 RepID=UPI002E0E1D12|nr:hypothetical protein OG735_01790 [Streptomyces sp. NBC_01210]